MSAAHAETFALALRSFVNEARRLARFDHPGLVKVHQFWEQHGTAYMVMPFYEGPTLRRVLTALGRPATDSEVGAWLMPLLDTLEVLHADRCHHRDIAPDTILNTAGGALLLDFGAARRANGDLTHAQTAVLKPGHAPIEQCGDSPDMSQGPWTDIYALASVLYGAMDGVRPVPSVERVMADRMRPLSELAAGRFRPGFLAAVDQALALRPWRRRDWPRRHRLLDALRDCAREKLEGLDPEGATAARHCAHCFSLSKESARGMHGAEQGAWVRRLEDECENLRAAAACALAGGTDPLVAVKLAVALRGFWFLRGHASEGRKLVQAALALPAVQASGLAQAWALYTGAALASSQGDHESAARMLETCLALRRELGNAVEIAASLSTLSLARLQAGDPEGAAACETEALALFAAAGDSLGQAIGWLHLRTYP